MDDEFLKIFLVRSIDEIFKTETFTKIPKKNTGKRHIFHNLIF